MRDYIYNVNTMIHLVRINCYIRCFRGHHGQSIHHSLIHEFHLTLPIITNSNTVLLNNSTNLIYTVTWPGLKTMLSGP